MPAAMPFAPYERSAEIYDVFYRQMVDYRANAAHVDALIRDRKPGATSLLEIACGTGLYLEPLAERYGVVGTDISPAMLERARRRLPGVELFEADMRTLDLGRRFDAVVCLFSSVAYLTELEELRAMIQCMAAHLNPGGVAILEPWFAPDAWEDGYVSASGARSEDLAVARASTSVRDGRVVTMTLAFAVAYPDGRVDTFVEEHPTGQFTVEEHLAAFVDAGLDVEYDPAGLTGRGVYIALSTAP